MPKQWQKQSCGNGRPPLQKFKRRCSLTVENVEIKTKTVNKAQKRDKTFVNVA